MRAVGARWSVLVVVAAGFLSGCGGAEQDPEPAEPTNEVSASSTPESDISQEPSLSAPPSDLSEDTETDQEPLPDTFLAPPPEESTVRGVTELGGTDFIVEFGVPGEQIAAGEAYRDQLVAADFTISKEQETNSSTGEPGLAFRAENESFSMQVTTGTDLYEPEQAIIKCSYNSDPA